jgi:dephospho-CoA kinase
MTSRASVAPPLRVGLTGNIGSGKSTVAALLAERGAAVIDADALARRATEDPVILRRIGETFGEGVERGGALDRAALARRVFGDDEARRALEAIVHPWVRAAAAAEEADLLARRAPEVVVHDVPLLFEGGLERGFDVTVVVTAPLATRVERSSRRSGLSAEAVRARDAAQMPLEEKARRATYVVDNTGSHDDLTRAVASLWSALLARRAGAPAG